MKWPFENKPYRIDIDLFDMPDQEILEAGPHYIEFHEDYFIYVGKFKIREYQDSTRIIGKDRWKDFYIRVQRDLPDRVDMVWSTDGDCWRVDIDDDSIALYVHKKAEARKIYRALELYLWGNTSLNNDTARNNG